ncbi:hypothetical protein [Roseomonas fluvialis]|uniref:Uncharacterized protein n=1 Tax=Roseomonas fluvialis TaxID=1750527 RepID=A0ABN6P894_9PROT|nr:hypothetical protein [Roseomonas fluvialis]BDG74470.1 hypothetical protein Rmf_43990 [Roseomonas fluvialis]
MPDNDGATAARVTTDALRRARALVCDEPRAQRRVWRVQRFGWAAMAVFVAAACAGVFGAGGPLTDRQARGGPSAPDVAYEGVVRLSRATTWSILLPAGIGTLALEASALEHFEPRLVVPRPIEERREESSLLMMFHASGGGRLRVNIVLTPTAPGLHEVRLTAGSGGAIMRIVTLP